jgi:uncharacterized membrane protein YGL010W
MIRLNREWTQLLAKYKMAHTHPKNQACHRIGIPMIAASFPLAATVVGLPLAAGLFTVGWGFQFLGHHYQGNDPAFFDDPRNLIVGVIWWLQKSGVEVRSAETTPA